MKLRRSFLSILCLLVIQSACLGVSTFKGVTSTLNITTDATFCGDGSAITGIKYSTLSGTSSTCSGNASTSNYAGLAGTASSASYSTLAGTATTAGYSTLAGTSTVAGYSTLSGTATTAGYSTLSGTASTCTGNSSSANYAILSGTSTTAGYATLAGSATSAGYATLSGTATSAGDAAYATLAALSTSAGYATLAGSATSASSADYAVLSATASACTGNALTAGYAGLAGSATSASYATLSGTASSASSADYATLAGTSSICTGSAATASYATLSGTSTVATTAVLKAGDTMTGTLTMDSTNKILYSDDRGNRNDLGILTTHWDEMTTDTLTDKSRSTLSCTGGVLTYTLIAVNGSGSWNFGGVKFQGSVPSGEVALTGGTNTTPETNYVYFELVGGTTPTLKRSTTANPAGTIRVAEFLVGTVTGETYTIFGYNRSRQELDSFVSRTLSRFETMGTLYESGFVPAFTTTSGTIGAGAFFNGVFKMYTTDIVSTGAFTSITGGLYNARTAPTSIVNYAGGETIGSNKYLNIVWGIVPTSTTSSGVTATIPRLYALPQSKPVTEYSTAIAAREDREGMTNYYPSSVELKEVFVPIARTVVQKGGNFQTFASGLYYEDIRGKITSGGGAATPVDLSGYVPYTGATSDLAMGSYGVSTNSDITYGKGSRLLRVMKNNTAASLEVGNVVILDISDSTGQSIKTATTTNDGLVFGVVSTRGDPAADVTLICSGYCANVSVDATTAIITGDALATYNMSAEAFKGTWNIGAVFGIALEAKASGRGAIKAWLF